LTNQEYSRLLGISHSVAKSSDVEFVSELLHVSLIRYEERTTVEKKQQLETDKSKISYIARIICNEFVQMHRNKSHTVIIDEIEVIEDESYSYPNVDVDCILAELEQTDKRGFYLANLFKVYMDCNCRILQVSKKTKINRQTLKNDIEEVKQYLKIRIWQEEEKQEA